MSRTASPSRTPTIRDLLRPHRRALVAGLAAVIGEGVADLLQPKASRTASERFRTFIAIFRTFIAIECVQAKCQGGTADDVRPSHGKIELEMIVWRLMTVFCSLAVIAPAQEKVNQDAKTLDDFSQRVEDYVQLRNDIRAQVHPLKKAESAAAIMRYQREFARRLRGARYGVEQGNIFTPEITAEFRRLIAITMQGPDGAGIRGSLASGTPVRFPDLQADQEYPPGSPLQSTPSSLLLDLPSLPKEVEYRVVGHNLVLRDTDADIIVDFIPHAIP